MSFITLQAFSLNINDLQTWLQCVQAQSKSFKYIIIYETVYRKIYVTKYKKNNSD